MDIIRLLDEEVLKERTNIESRPWDGSVPRVITRCKDADVNMLQKHVGILHSEHFETGWVLSYKEKGTIINARRPEGTDNKGFQKQLHCRARVVVVNGDLWLEWSCHTEYAPVQNPSWHRHNKDVNHKEGQKHCYNCFDVDGIEAKKVAPDWSPDKVVS